MASQSRAETNCSQRRRADSAVEKPRQQFFKIVLQSTIQDKKLGIPPKFVRKFGNELSDIAKLSIPCGRVWKMGLRKCNEDIWLDDGWHEFVEHYSIHCGSLLVFNYKGFSSFDVLIFDMTACEIQYPCNCHHHDEEHQGDEMEVDDGDDSVQILDSNPRLTYCSSKTRVSNKTARKGVTCRSFRTGLENKKQTRSKDYKNEQQETIDSDFGDVSRQGKLIKKELLNSYGLLLGDPKDKKKAKTRWDEHELTTKYEKDIEIVTTERFFDGSSMVSLSPERERAIQAAIMSKPDNPSFLAVLQPYNLFNFWLYVPAAFSRKYLSNTPGYIKIQDSNGREWPCRVNRIRPGSVRLGKGWSAFVRENNLAEGDACVFELIKARNVVLKLTAFRVSSYILNLTNQNGGSS